MQEIFDSIGAVFDVVKATLWSKKYECLLGVILCFIWNVIEDPEGAINQFMIHVVDVVFAQLPSTPEDYKLASILADFAASNTAIGWGVLWEIIQVPMGLLSMLLVIKLIQFLKP
jgi:hypothetical protein